jgi:hypothetical protein
VNVTCRKVAGSSRGEVDFFSLPNPSIRTMALGLTQPLTETSTRNHPGGGGNGRLARRADNLTAIYESIVWTKCGSLDVSQPYGASRPELALKRKTYFFPTPCSFVKLDAL